jgi:hypothetical protein
VLLNLLAVLTVGPQLVSASRLYPNRDIDSQLAAFWFVAGHISPPHDLRGFIGRSTAGKPNSLR